MKQILLKHALVWGMSEETDILIRGEKILYIGQGLCCDSAQVINLKGKTLLPGFFNAHVHLYGVPGPLPDELLRRFVLGGVTTVRDMGMTSAKPFEAYQEWLSTRKGPDFPTIITSGKFICGPNTYGAVHPSGEKIGYVIEENPEAAIYAVDAMVDAGADGIKTGLDYGMDPQAPLEYLPEDVFRAICQRAKERGVPSAAHITKTDNFIKAAAWGLTECAHVPTDELTDEQVKRVAESGMAFTATASIFDMVSAETGEQIMDAVISNIGKLHGAGVPMAVGTDFMFENPPYQTPGIPIHELRLLKKAGLTVDEIVRAATIDSAERCGIAARTGSVTEGKDADLIAISGELDGTFSALEHVDLVIHRGEVIKTEL